MKDRPSTNRLGEETSPYLLQHAHNPVDWYPWGDEALNRASEENRLILLSIGYAACHWCHVMERESFENEGIAKTMNEHFVSIKVDREERPDLDEIYMAATMITNNGQGGWPMTVFLTPDLEPVFAGTYFPPVDSYGRPGFHAILHRLAEAWSSDPARLRAGARQVTEHIRQLQRPTGPGEIGDAELEQVLDQFYQEFDAEYGGFGAAPKFPPATGLSLLLRLYRRQGDERALAMVNKTLESMANGGIHDHIAGGFARYSTDRKWLVPHFEKMLYDNALLSRVYLEAYQVTRNGRFRDVAERVLDYILREMTSPEGGFYSSTDADSEGEEGRFFVWTPEETAAVLGKEAAERFNAYFDITPGGNWEGKNIPNTPRSLEDVAATLSIGSDELKVSIKDAIEKIYDARNKRTKPGLDNKILAAWNGMMIGAMAYGYRVLRRERYLEAAVRAADFVLTNLASESFPLLRTLRTGKPHIVAHLEDYAHVCEGLLELYEVSGNSTYRSAARRLADRMVGDYFDRDSGTFFSTPSGAKHLIARFRSGTDGATPSPCFVAAQVVARLSYHFDEPALREIAAAVLRGFGKQMKEYPRAYCMGLSVYDFLARGPTELALVTDPGSPDLELMLDALALEYLPNRIQAIGYETDDEDRPPLLRAKNMVDGKTSLYVCRNYTCASPLTDPNEISGTLARI